MARIMRREMDVLKFNKLRPEARMKVGSSAKLYSQKNMRSVSKVPRSERSNKFFMKFPLKIPRYLALSNFLPVAGDTSFIK